MEILRFQHQKGRLILSQSVPGLSQLSQQLTAYLPPDLKDVDANIFFFFLRQDHEF